MRLNAIRLVEGDLKQIIRLPHIALQMNRLGALFLFLAAVLLTCSRQPSDDYVAKIGKRTICPSEYRLRFEFTPHVENASSGGDNKISFLALLIGEKLLAEEAERRGKARDKKYSAQIRQMEKEALVEALFYEKIAPSVQVTQQEIDDAFAKSQTDLVLQLWNFKDEEKAKEFLGRAMACDSISQTNSRRSASLTQPESIKVAWGKSDPSLEEIAYDLQLGEFSEAIEAAGQYRIVRLLEKVPAADANETTIEQRRANISDILRARKESAAIEHMLDEIMRNKTMRVAHEIFDQVATALETALQGSEPTLHTLPDSSGSLLRENQVQRIRKDLAELMDKPFARFDDGSFWTVGDFIERLAVGPYRLPTASAPYFRKALRLTLKKAVELENLAAEAERQGLKNSAYVREQVQMWSDALLAQSLLHKIAETIEVSESDLRDYYRTNTSKFWTPEMVNLCRLTLATESMARSLLKRIEAGESMEVLARQYSLRAGSETVSCETGLITLGSLGNARPYIENAGVGEVIGPVKIKANSFVLLKVLERRQPGTPPFETVTEEIYRTVKIEKTSQAYDGTLTELMGKASIHIDHTVLDSMVLSSSGSVVYKGHFPGRMIAPVVYPFGQLRGFGESMSRSTRRSTSKSTITSKSRN